MPYTSRAEFFELNFHYLPITVISPLTQGMNLIGHFGVYHA